MSNSKPSETSEVIIPSLQDITLPGEYGLQDKTPEEKAEIKK